MESSLPSQFKFSTLLGPTGAPCLQIVPGKESQKTKHYDHATAPYLDGISTSVLPVNVQD